jgi:DNA-damage-inducible protein D
MWASGSAIERKDTEYGRSDHHSACITFDAIRRVDEQGNEYWSARELYKLLGYSIWQKFQQSISDAQRACEKNGQAISDHFNLEVKMITGGERDFP